MHACNLSTRSLKQKDPKFKASLGYEEKDPRQSMLRGRGFEREKREKGGGVHTTVIIRAEIVW